MPWQRQVLDVAYEYRREVDGALHLFYREVDLTVPRQSGKTTLLLPTQVHRSVSPDFGGPQRINYTAQTRNDARVKWTEDYVEALKAAVRAGRLPRGLFTVRLANGSESIKWRTGSRMGITATTEKSGHGPTLDLGIVDEAFAQIDNRVEQAMGPAMITRPCPQLWVVSTAGTPESAYLWSKVEAGRRAVSEGRTDGVAYFEWSADDDADPGDEDTWWSCMPALGITQPVAAVRAEYDKAIAQGKLGEFRRAYLNQWTTQKADPVIPLEVWHAGTDLADPLASPVAFAFDVTPDRANGSIGAASRMPDGDLRHLEVVANGEGVEWIVPRLAELVARWGPVAVAYDPASPAGSLVPALVAAGIEPKAIGSREHAQACGLLYDLARATPSRLKHRDQPILTAALDGAMKRPLGDSWAWNRKSSAVDISPLVACTLALWALDSAPMPEPAPELPQIILLG